MNLTAPIRQHAAQSPDATAVIRPDDRGVPYRDLDRTVDALAYHLLDAGLAAGDVVAIQVVEPYAQIVLRLALARLGIGGGPAAMPVAMRKALVTAGGAPPVGNVKVVAFDPAWVDAPAADRIISAVAMHEDGAALGGLFPTSGTTGNPKLVALSADTMAKRIELRGHSIPLPANAAQICMIGLGAFFGFSSVLRVLWSGGRAVLPARDATVEQIVAAIRRHGVNHLVLSPLSLEQLVVAVPEGEGPLPSLASIEVSGSAVPAALYDAARRRICANLVCSYGGTELGQVAAAPMADLRGKPGAVGYVNPSVEVEALDPTGRTLPRGVEGVLRVRSPVAATAYVDNAAASAETFRDGWVYPGDMGTVSADGVLTISGRSGEVINSGGNKVDPRAVEDVLLAFPGIRQAAAFGVPDSMGLTHVWAAVVVDAPLDPVALHTFCARRLGPVAPKRVMRMDALPLTDTGKIARFELARLVVDRFHGAGDPGTEATPDGAR